MARRSQENNRDDHRPFLSVIIPAHNEEKTICKTVDSLLRQDYSLFEIIIVDDGSTDRTDEIMIEHYWFEPVTISFQKVLFESKRIIRAWSVERNKIQLYLVKKENGGKGDTLNVGISFCSGEYFVCIDADCIIPVNTLTILVDKLKYEQDVVAVGGAIFPILGISVYVNQRIFEINSFLQGFQELEYGIAFNIVRQLYDNADTTMLISGALGLFKRDLVIKLGGYALDTVGEDMELVMRIRQYSATNDRTLKIRYTKNAMCYTELPWKISDWIQQRIRWTVGLSDVLWKYRDVATEKGYSLKERIAYWYYVAFEKFSPYAEIIGVVLYGGCGKILMGLIQMMVIATLRVVISLIGSYDSIKQTVKSSDRKLISIVKIGLLLMLFVTIYHYIHSFVRMIAVPYHQIKKRKSKNKNAVWNSPSRK